MLKLRLLCGCLVVYLVAVSCKTLPQQAVTSAVGSSSRADALIDEAKETLKKEPLAEKSEWLKLLKEQLDRASTSTKKVISELETFVKQYNEVAQKNIVLATTLDTERAEHDAALLGGRGKRIQFWLLVMGWSGIALRILGLLSGKLWATICAWIGNILMALSLWAGCLILVGEFAYQRLHLQPKGRAW